MEEEVVLACGVVVTGVSDSIVFGVDQVDFGVKGRGHLFLVFILLLLLFPTMLVSVLVLNLLQVATGILPTSVSSLHLIGPVQLVFNQLVPTAFQLVLEEEEIYFPKQKKSTTIYKNIAWFCQLYMLDIHRNLVTKSPYDHTCIIFVYK